MLWFGKTYVFIFHNILSDDTHEMNVQHIPIDWFLANCHFYLFIVCNWFKKVVCLTTPIIICFLSCACLLNICF